MEKKIAIKLLKFVMPVNLVRDVLDVIKTEVGDKVNVSFVSARTRTGIPVTRINIYVEECEQEKMKALEKRVMDLILKYNMKPTVFRGIECREVEKRERTEVDELSS